MSEPLEEIQQAKEPSSLRKFSKVRLLQTLGLLNKKFNYETLEFESSWRFSFMFFLTLTL